MRTSKKVSVLFIMSILTLFFFSCKKEKEYVVHSEFEPYIQQFIDEGNKHGKSFDFHKTGLIMEFADLSDKESAAGLCYFTDPIKIEIDEVSWAELKGKNNAELCKELLIFHELGHGFLNRRHKNDLFLYGDWASLMHGSVEDNKITPPPDSRKSWNINYRGFRHEYYVAELFESNIQAPSWASLQIVFSDNPNENIIFKDDFDSNANYWNVGVEDDIQAEIINGYYKVQAINEKAYYCAKDIPLDKTKDFYIELDIKFIPQEDVGNWQGAGLVWGGDDGDNLYYLSYTKDKRIIIGNYMNYGWYIELPCPSLKIDDYNKIVIRKIDDIFYLSINEAFVYHTDYDGFFGDLIGFHLSRNSTIWVDKIQVSYLTMLTKGYDEVVISKETYLDVIPEIKVQNIKR